MCGRPAVAPSSTSARTPSSVTGMPSAAISATIRSSRVSRLSRARCSSATSCGVVGVGQVGEQVDAAVPPAARDLDAGHEPDAVRPRRVARLGPAQGRVVVGERQRAQPGLDRPLHDDGRRLGAVARRRVGVQVDDHAASVVARDTQPRWRQPFPASRRSAGCGQDSRGGDEPDRQGRARRRLHGVRRAGDAVAAAHRVAAHRATTTRRTTWCRRRWCAPTSPGRGCAPRPRWPTPDAILVNERTDRWRRHGAELRRGRAARAARRRPASAAEDRDVVVRLLATLPDQQRKVVVLRYYSDLSEQATADALNISVGSVKSAASRGLATLRAELAPEPKEECDEHRHVRGRAALPAARRRRMPRARPTSTSTRTPWSPRVAAPFAAAGMRGRARASRPPPWCSASARGPCSTRSSGRDAVEPVPATRSSSVAPDVVTATVRGRGRARA